MRSVVEAAYQAGAFVADAAWRFVAGTVRAAESIAAEAAEHARAARPDPAPPARKPPQKAQARAVRRRRRAS